MTDRTEYLKGSMRVDGVTPRAIAYAIPDEMIPDVIREFHPDTDKIRGEQGIIASGLIQDSEGMRRVFVGLRDFLTERVAFYLMVVPKRMTDDEIAVGNIVSIDGTLDRTIGEIDAKSVKVVRSVFA